MKNTNPKKKPSWWERTDSTKCFLLGTLLIIFSFSFSQGWVSYLKAGIALVLFGVGILLVWLGFKVKYETSLKRFIVYLLVLFIVTLGGILFNNYLEEFGIDKGGHYREFFRVLVILGVIVGLLGLYEVQDSFLPSKKDKK